MPADPPIRLRIGSDGETPGATPSPRVQHEQIEPLTPQQTRARGNRIRSERCGRIGEEQYPPARADRELLGTMRRTRPPDRQARRIKQPHPRIIAVLAAQRTISSLGAPNIEHDDVQPRNVALRHRRMHRRQRNRGLVPQRQEHRDWLGDLRGARPSRVQMK